MAWVTDRDTRNHHTPRTRKSYAFIHSSIHLFIYLRRLLSWNVRNTKDAQRERVQGSGVADLGEKAKAKAKGKGAPEKRARE